MAVQFLWQLLFPYLFSFFDKYLVIIPQNGRTLSIFIIGLQNWSLPPGVAMVAGQKLSALRC